MAGHNPAVWFEIYVSDMERALKFYRAVLGREFELMSPPGDELELWGFKGGGPEGYGANGALVKFPGTRVGGSSVMVYFGCEDCAVEESRVEAAGGKVHKPKRSIGPYGHISIVEDTEGNAFGLHSMK